jgi:4a-hydroxytetrahydrobiopterin dehydratase
MALTAEQVQGRMAEIPGWTYRDNALVRQFTFDGFPDAIAFVTRLAFDAEGADHHPDLLVSYKRVTVTWSTHDAGGVTDKDFAGVRQSDAAARRLLQK